MCDSERLQRFKENIFDHIVFSDYYDPEKVDERLAERIRALLNNPKIDSYCMVDAYYYDFCEMPDELHEKLNLWCDCYLIYGITIEAQIISKWVSRWDLDSSDPIVDGKVIRPPSKNGLHVNFPPDIRQNFNPDLLSTPISDLKKCT